MKQPWVYMCIISLNLAFKPGDGYNYHSHFTDEETEASNDLANTWWIFIPGEGNGTPLQYSCLENPMDGGAW